MYGIRDGIRGVEIGDGGYRAQRSSGTPVTFGLRIGEFVKRSVSAFFMLLAVPLFMTACGDNEEPPQQRPPPQRRPPAPPHPLGAGISRASPSIGGPAGADGSGGNNLTQDYCAHNQDPGCPTGSFVGPYTQVHDNHGTWDAAGNPVNGGPAGADGSTGNNLTHEYCAKNENPG